MLHFDVISFLNEYEQHSCLWNKIDPEFKNRMRRNNSEKILMKKFNIADVQTLRRKIRNIRGTYNSEVRKIRNSKRSGAETANMYKPKLAWFDAANRFLRATTEIFSESNVGPQVRNDDFGLELNPIIQLRVDHSAKCQIIDSTQQSMESIENDEESTSGSSVLTVEPSPAKRRRKTVQPSYCRQQKLSIDNAVKTLREISNPNTTNEFISFGNSVAAQLQKLPISMAVKLQEDIQCLITQRRLKHLNNQSVDNNPMQISTIEEPVADVDNENTNAENYFSSR